MKVLVVSESLNVNGVRLRVIDTRRFKGNKIIEERKKIDGRYEFVTIGDPIEEISKFANAIDVDVVVTDDPDVGLKVASRLSKPVVVTQNFDRLFERGLIGYNPLVFDDEVKRKIERLPFKDVQIVHVLESITPYVVKSVDKVRVEEFLKEIVEKVDNISAYHLKVGDPAEEILKTAEEVKASCVILSPSLKKISIGSTASRIVKARRFPVMLWKDFIKRNGFIQYM